MTLGHRRWLLLCLLPLLFLAVAPLFPSGSDPRGFGPRFAVGLIACAASVILGLAGIGTLFFAARLQIPKTWAAISTCVAAAPFVYLIILVFLGKA
jgi:drug/metabolite transporter (DMT)-like permease